MSFLYSTHAPEAFLGEPDEDDMPLTRRVNPMAEDQSAIIENIYDLTLLANHADSLVSRMEGKVEQRASPLPLHTGREAAAIATRLTVIANRLRHAVRDHQLRAIQPAE